VAPAACGAASGVLPMRLAAHVWGSRMGAVRLMVGVAIVASCADDRTEEPVGAVQLAANGPLQAVEIAAPCKFNATGYELLEQSGNPDDVPPPPPKKPSLLPPGFRRAQGFGYRCTYRVTCASDADAPAGADAACKSSLDEQCAAHSFTMRMDEFSGSVPCSEYAPTHLNNACREIAAYNATLTPLPEASATCSVPIPRGPLTGLCPSTDTTVFRGPGCNGVAAPGTGNLHLLENGAVDGKSATFKCEWVEYCTLTPKDPEDPVVSDSERVTICRPADGKGRLCDAAAQAEFAQHAQRRLTLFTRSWNDTMRQYLDPYGAFYVTISRADVRDKAKADCNAQTVTLLDRTNMCQNALSAALNAQASRLSYCCTEHLEDPDASDDSTASDDEGAPETGDDGWGWGWGGDANDGGAGPESGTGDADAGPPPPTP
jgi:hypothetical protein